MRALLIGSLFSVLLASGPAPAAAIPQPRAAVEAGCAANARDIVVQYVMLRGSGIPVEELKRALEGPPGMVQALHAFMDAYEAQDVAAAQKAFERAVAECVRANLEPDLKA